MLCGDSPDSGAATGFLCWHIVPASLPLDFSILILQQETDLLLKCPNLSVIDPYVC